MKTWISKDKNGNVEKVEYREENRTLDKRDKINCSLQSCGNPAVRWFRTAFNSIVFRCEKHIEDRPLNSSSDPTWNGPVKYDDEGPYEGFYDDVFWNHFDILYSEETKSDFLMKVLRYAKPGWSPALINSTASSNSQLSWDELDSEVTEIIIRFRDRIAYG